jgi:hypothetical protein
MTISKLTETYRQVLLNEYSEGFTRKIIALLRPTAPRNMSDQELRAMINRFDQLKTGRDSKQRIKQIVSNAMADEDMQTFRSTDPKQIKRLEKLALDPLDIQLYDYPQLEVIIHNFGEVTNTPKQKAPKQNDIPETGAELIYSNPNNGIDIYYGATHNACKVFSRDYLPSTNQFKNGKFTWCIGQNDSPYHFWQYRFGIMGDAPESTYFVVDKTLSGNDESSVLVVMALENGKFVPTTRSNLTKSAMSFDDVVKKYQPKLKGLEKYFVFHPLTDEEEKHYIVSNTDPKRFAGLSFANKVFYISAGKQILAKDWPLLDANLQHGYISVRAPNVADWVGGAAFDKNLNARVIKKRLIKLLAPFADDFDQRLEAEKSKKESVLIANDLIEKGIDIEQDLSWQQPFWDVLDKYFKETKKNQDVRLWKSLVDSVLLDSGHAAAPNE